MNEFKRGRASKSGERPRKWLWQKWSNKTHDMVLSGRRDNWGGTSHKLWIKFEWKLLQKKNPQARCRGFSQRRMKAIVWWIQWLSLPLFSQPWQVSTPIHDCWWNMYAPQRQKSACFCSVTVGILFHLILYFFKIFKSRPLKDLLLCIEFNVEQENYFRYS